jgi:branched-chain amino acid transport system substrate-binding protein
MAATSGHEKRLFQLGRNRVATIFLCLVLVLGGPAVASGDPVKIGILNNPSGVGADLAGSGSIVAAKLAIEDVGPVLGADVAVVSADHQDKADVGLGIAKEWYSEDGVDAIFDLPNSGVALAVSGEAARHKKLAFVSTGGSDKLTEDQCNGYTFVWTYNSSSLARASVAEQLAAGRNKWYLLTWDYVAGRSFDSAIRSELASQGGTILGTSFAPLGTSDYSQYILKAAASGANLIEVALVGTDVISAVKQLQEFGVIANGQHLGVLTLTDTDVHSGGASAFAGVESVISFAWNRTPETKAFSERFYKRVGRMPTMYQAGVYSSVLNYLKAVNAAGTKDTQAVLTILRSQKTEDMFAQNATLEPNGLLKHDMYLVRVKKPEQMEGQWDFYEILATVPADKAYPPLADSKCPLVKH